MFAKSQLIKLEFINYKVYEIEKQTTKPSANFAKILELLAKHLKKILKFVKNCATASISSFMSSAALCYEHHNAQRKGKLDVS